MDCIIPANSDVAGIGVRFSIYFQAIFSVLSTAVRFYARTEGESSDEFVKTTYDNSVALILAGLAIAISGVIQARTYGLDVYHTLLMLDLCWVIIVGALVPFIVILSLYREKDDAQGPNERKEPSNCLSEFLSDLPYVRKHYFGLTGLWEKDPLIRYPTRLHQLHSLHLTFTSCVGLWFFIRLRTFDTTPGNCTSSTIAVIAGRKDLIVTHPYHIFSLIVYSIFIIPVLNVFLIQLIFILIPLAILKQFLKIFATITGSDEGSPWYRFIQKVCRGPALRAVPMGALLLVIVSTEETITANNVAAGENQWTLGQTLAIFGAVIPTIDFNSWAFSEIYKWMRPNTNAAGSAQPAALTSGQPTLLKDGSGQENRASAEIEKKDV